MILFFSGTGNSRHIAASLSSIIGDGIPADMGDMMKRGETPEFQSESPYVFVVPTYGWRIPRVVDEFIRKCKFRGSDKAYFILTCGDSIGNAGKYAQRLCADMGMEFKGCAGLKMPENYVAMFAVPDEETSERLIAAADRSLKATASKIAAGEKLPDKYSAMGAVESSVVNGLFYKFIVKARGFRVGEECIVCGLCQDVCPLNNVRLVDGKPGWGNSCTHCMACICRCPKEAIEYKNISVGKRRYYLDE